MATYEEYQKYLLPTIKLNNLNVKKVADFVNSLDLSKTSGKENYIKTAVLNHKQELVEDYHNLVFIVKSNLQKEGYEVNDKQVYYVNSILVHAYTEFPNSITDIQSIIANAKKESANSKSFNDFYKSIKKQLEHKANIPYKYLQEQAESFVCEHNKLIKELGDPYEEGGKR